MARLKQQCPTCKDWYAHGFCGNCERVMADVQPVDVGEVIKREGWFCTSCGHRHAGPTLANICVGCSCPVTEHTTAEDDWIRIASENAKDATARLEAAQAKEHIIEIDEDGKVHHQGMGPDFLFRALRDIHMLARRGLSHTDHEMTMNRLRQIVAFCEKAGVAPASVLRAEPITTPDEATKALRDLSIEAQADILDDLAGDAHADGSSEYEGENYGQGQRLYARADALRAGAQALRDSVRIGAFDYTENVDGTITRKDWRQP